MADTVATLACSLPTGYLWALRLGVLLLAVTFASAAVAIFFDWCESKLGGKDEA